MGRRRVRRGQQGSARVPSGKAEQASAHQTAAAIRKGTTANNAPPDQSTQTQGRQGGRRRRRSRKAGRTAKGGRGKQVASGVRSKHRRQAGGNELQTGKGNQRPAAQARGQVTNAIRRKINATVRSQNGKVKRRRGARQQRTTATASKNRTNHRVQSCKQRGKRARGSLLGPKARGGGTCSAARGRGRGRCRHEPTNQFCPPTVTVWQSTSRQYCGAPGGGGGGWRSPQQAGKGAGVTQNPPKVGRRWQAVVAGHPTTITSHNTTGRQAGWQNPPTTVGKVMG